MGTNRYLVRPEPPMWVLEHDGELIDSYTSRAQAVEAARRSAQRERGELILVNAEGRVEEEQRFGSTDASDPAG